MPPKILYTVILCLIVSAIHGQTKLRLNNSSYGTQYGFSIKAQMEFSTVKQTQLPHIRVAVAGGIGSSFIDNNIYPAFNAELQLYNNGLGSSKPGKKKPALNLDIVTAFTITAGIKDLLQKNRSQLLIERNVPLYYFTDLGLPALKNPFAYSVSVGTDIIFNTDKEKKMQRTGFLNFHFDRFQISYANDGGPPMSNIQLGDKKDRYYTGDVLFSYHGKPFTAINLVELSYHKFTGYTKNSFEASNQFDFAYVNYKDTIQRFYNKSLFTLNIANPVKGYGVNVKLYNRTKWDVQHLIHWSIYNSYHIVPYKEHVSLAGNYYLSRTTIGLK
jgi:hypothetical protein